MFVESIRRALSTDSISSGFGGLRGSSRILQIPELNTSITYPREQETLNEMLFHPQKLQLATTGNDGFIKFWGFVQENPITSN